MTLTTQPYPIKHKLSTSNSWMIIYTRSNWEKKVCQLLINQGIECYCPLIKIRKKWADRYKTIYSPLFKSYLFVYITIAEQSKILQCGGVINFVKHCSKPVLIFNSEIERIKGFIQANDSNLEIVTCRTFGIGDKIIINNGPFINHEGHITDINGSNILMVLEQLGCALVLKISQDQVRLIS